MPVPPPLADPSHVETRLVVVTEMLERAVTELRRAMAEIQGQVPADDPTDLPGVPTDDR